MLGIQTVKFVPTPTSLSTLIVPLYTTIKVATYLKFHDFLTVQNFFCYSNVLLYAKVNGHHFLPRPHKASPDGNRCKTSKICVVGYIGLRFVNSKDKKAYIFSVKYFF